MTPEEMIEALRADKLESEFIDGDWLRPGVSGQEPWALVTYAEEPSPETGHEGWCWWAMGKMGEAPTFDAARRAAVDALLMRMAR